MESGCSLGLGSGRVPCWGAGRSISVGSALLPCLQAVIGFLVVPDPIPVGRGAASQENYTM